MIRLRLQHWWDENHWNKFWGVKFTFYVSLAQKFFDKIWTFAWKKGYPLPHFFVETEFPQMYYLQQCTNFNCELSTRYLVVFVSRFLHIFTTNKYANFFLVYATLLIYVNTNIHLTQFFVFVLALYVPRCVI